MGSQPESQFAAAYEKGVHKTKYWEYYYEDAMNLIAKLPGVAAHIYRTTYHGGKLIGFKKDLDWAANLAHMMGARPLSLGHLAGLPSMHGGRQVCEHEPLRAAIMTSAWVAHACDICCSDSE